MYSIYKTFSSIAYGYGKHLSIGPSAQDAVPYCLVRLQRRKAALKRIYCHKYFHEAKLRNYVLCHYIYFLFFMPQDG